MSKSGLSVVLFAVLAACAPEGVESVSDVPAVEVDAYTLDLADQDAKRRVCRDTSTKTYVAVGTQCQLVRFTCAEGWGYFSDSCGCGCELL
jgi:hypothetical protein